MEAERTAIADDHPKVMPHPALIARYVQALLTTLDTDVPKARAILMRVLRPLTPHTLATREPLILQRNIKIWESPPRPAQ
jgi:hypothetical protein